MRRALLLALLIATVLPPSAADAKEGALFVPQLTGLLPNVLTREELYVLPTARLPAGPVGAVPVVVLRSGPLTRRFTGTPIDGLHRSVVWVELPQSPGDRRWVAVVRVAGRTYPDGVDVAEVPGSAWFVPAPADPPGPRPRGRPSAPASPVPWLAALGCILVAITVRLRPRRMAGR